MMNSKEEKPLNVTSFTQWAAAFGAFLLTMQVGINLGWSSPNISYLSSKDSPIPMTPREASMMISYGALAGLVGAILGSTLINYIGSKKTVLLTLLFVNIVWMCIIIPNSSIEWLYVSRILSGLTLIMITCCLPVFIGEISKAGNRGTLISITVGGTPFGTVIGTIAETYLPMKISSSIYLTQCLVAMILFTWLMESPYYLVKKNNYERARKSIAFYWPGCDVESELCGIKSFVEADPCLNLKDILKEFKSPVVRKSMLLIIILFSLPIVSGKINLLFYMESILKSGKSHLIPPKEFVIYANIVNFITSFLTFKLIDKLGRKFLLITSAVGTSVSLAGLGIYFYLLNFNIDARNIQWLPIATILLFLIVYTIGFTPVPTTVLSEIFPQKTKSIAVCIANISASMFVFIFIAGYQVLVETLGQAYVFWIHAGLCLLTTICVLYLLPETKGKTFQEIQADLHKRHK